VTCRITKKTTNYKNYSKRIKYTTTVHLTVFKFLFAVDMDTLGPITLVELSIRNSVKDNA